jgi:hypothetical protein
MFMYGQGTAKAWWQMEQAVVAGLMLYNLTGSSVYLQMADETLLFYMAYFVDHVYGDVYSDVAHDGAGWLWNNAKGSSGKAAYHSTETGYYVYLYGKLLLKGEPATLHYKIAPRAVSQDVALNPIALASSKYRVSNVALNAAPYADFDGVNRVLHIPAGTGGHFVVTFAPAPAASVATAGLVPSRFELAQNFPNPFNPRTTIRYSIPAETHVHLGVYDLLGREVATLVDTRQAPGRYDVGFDGSRLASGMYVYHLTAGAFSSAKKLVLVR